MHLLLCTQMNRHILQLALCGGGCGYIFIMLWCLCACGGIVAAYMEVIVICAYMHGSGSITVCI